LQPEGLSRSTRDNNAVRLVPAVEFRRRRWIEGAVCIVTVASSGIGTASARLLSGLGAKVVLAARRAERLESLSLELPGSHAVTSDVTIAEHVEHLVTRTIETYGRVDVLVNNAAQGLHVPYYPKTRLHH
jgi:NADP-dependent 3-hydroxy acid dehydrogenase YdfG